MRSASPQATLLSSVPKAHPARRLVPLLALVASVGYVCRVDVTVIGPALMSEFSLSQVQMGELSSVFLIGYTALQVPAGWLADRIPIRRLLLTTILAWALTTAAGAAPGWQAFRSAHQAFVALLVLRVILGSFSAPIYPASARAIAVNIAPHSQGRANGVVLASIGIGSAITPPLLGHASARWGWRAALLVAAALAALAGLLWATHSPSERAIGSGGLKPSRESAGQPARSPLGQRSFWYLAASYTVQGYVGYVFVFWFYLYLVQVRHFELLKAAWLAALPWTCSLVAIPLGGTFSDWAVRRVGPTWGRRAVPLAGLVACGALLAVGANTERAMIAVAVLTLSTALVLSTEGPFWATMNQIAGARSGIGGGVMNFGSNLGGLVSPVLTPWLASKFGWEVALSITGAMAILGGLLWLGVKFREMNTPVGRTMGPTGRECATAS